MTSIPRYRTRIRVHESVDFGTPLPHPKTAVETGPDRSGDGGFPLSPKRSTLGGPAVGWYRRK